MTERLSDSWMYYCGLLAMHGVGVDDLKHIQNLIDAEEQGKLLILPCKVGDKVWFIREISVKRELIETEVEKVISKKGRIYIQLSCNSFYETSCNSIGKTVFFSKAEAEAALEKMKGEEHE
jgi:hypothetical protein